MTDEPFEIRIPRDLAEPSPKVKALLAEIGDRRLEAMGPALSLLEDRATAGLRQALEHLDPVVLRSTATVAQALTGTPAGRRIVVRYVERARTDPEFVEDLKRSESVVRSDPTAAAAVERFQDSVLDEVRAQPPAAPEVDDAAEVQRIENQMHEPWPPAVVNFLRQLPPGLAASAFFAGVSLGTSALIMNSDGFSETDQVQISKEILDEGRGFPNLGGGKKGRRESSNDDEE